MKYIASLDVGTTTTRCHIIDQNGVIVGTHSELVEVLYPRPGHVEIDPEVLWNTVRAVVRDAIRNAGLKPEQITALGISTQRSTFVTWDRKTGKPFHNFITWKDLRADSIVRKWNNSFTWRVTCRLYWALTNIPALKEAAAKNEALFGTVDTWLVHKMTSGRLHITDVSAASATGFFDPFTMQWAGWALGLFGIPESILPSVGDSAGFLGECSLDVWGAYIPIRSLVADQSASVFGACCYQSEYIKVTLGTGTFLNINTARKPHASVKGLYPVVGWRFGKDDLVYLVEGASNDTANVVNWGVRIGLYNDPSQSSVLAGAVPDSDGVYFIPAFSGIQAPINDFQAAAGFLGIKPTTRKEHLVRAMLESLTFRVAQLLKAVQDETDCTYSLIRVDGGVSRSDVVCQMLADLSGLPVERPTNSEMSAMGAAFLAGLASGVWSSVSDLCELREVDKLFTPRYLHGEKLRSTMSQWERAVGRFLDWYSAEERGSPSDHTNTSEPGTPSTSSGVSSGNNSPVNSRGPSQSNQLFEAGESPSIRL